MNKPLNKNTLTQNPFTQFAYNGMKLDNEVSGNGNSYTTLFRELDVRLGRWWAVDPKSEKMPWQSSYNAMDNNPIWHNDPLGDWVKGKGFWKNITNSDAKLKAKDHALKNGGTATRKGFGKWDVTKVNENRISNNEGKTRLEYIIENRTFNKENSNDLTDHGNAFFNFLGLLDYGVSNLRGSKDNYGEGENKAPYKKVDFEANLNIQVFSLKTKISIHLSETGSESVSGDTKFKVTFDNNRDNWNKLNIGLFAGYNGYINTGNEALPDVNVGGRANYGVLQGGYTQSTNGMQKVTVGFGISTDGSRMELTPKTTSETTIINF